MGLFSFNKPASKINWEPLTNSDQLTTIKAESEEKPMIILKHSTRCSISLMAKSRLDNNWDVDEQDTKLYYLDLLRYRDLSNQIANDFKVLHESPQILIIKKGQCTYSATHSAIDARTVKQNL